MNFPKGDYASLCNFYGNPDNHTGAADPLWQAKNIIRITPPYSMRFSWGPPITTLAIHRLCADSLKAVLVEIGETFPAQDRAKYQLDQCGGTFNFRLQRGSSSKLSVHAFGAAIDLAPVKNGLGLKYSAEGDMIPPEVVKIFAKNGWVWGGSFSRPDCMHFQATSTAN